MGDMHARWRRGQFSLRTLLILLFIGGLASFGLRLRYGEKTLALKQAAPATVLVGQTVTVDIEVQNAGTDARNDIILAADIPDELQHPIGRELEYSLGRLLAGQKTRLQLALKAMRPGRATHTLILRTSDGNEVRDTIEIDVR